MAESGPSATWTPPHYDYSKTPALVSSTRLHPDDDNPHNFARMAKWCPDGSAALAQCENRHLQTLEMPPELASLYGEDGTHPTARVFRQPSPILDFTWFPAASTRDPASFCFMASVRECPVKLLDANDGRLRASYSIIDHRERFIAPHSLAFNCSADRLFCGFEDAIEVFEVRRPGEGTRLHITPSKKSKDGLKGIVSALAFVPDATTGVYAAGSLSPSAPTSSNIALFSEATGEAPLMFVGGDKGIGGIRASVTQLAFNPMRPHLLYASFRRHDAIYEWDIRGDAQMPVRTFRRGRSVSKRDSNRTEAAGTVTTNQKLRFDIDISGQILGAGGQDGKISMFNLAAGDISQTGSVELTEATRAPQPGPAMQYKAHDDAVGSVSLHPLQPILLSVSGSRHFHLDGLEEGSESSTSTSESELDSGNDHVGQPGGGPPATVKFKRRRPQPVTLDASVKYWSFQAGAYSTGPETAGSDDNGLSRSSRAESFIR